MNLTLTNLNQPAPQAKPAAATSGTNAPLAADVPGLARSPGAAQALPDDRAQPAPVQPALAFAQWLDREQIAPVAVQGAPLTPDNAALDAKTPAEAEEQKNADAPLLGAMTMSMPPMPVAHATLAAVTAAMPGVPAAKAAAPAAAAGLAPSPPAVSPHREDRAAQAGLPAAAIASSQATAATLSQATALPLAAAIVLPSAASPAQPRAGAAAASRAVPAAQPLAAAPALTPDAPALPLAAAPAPAPGDMPAQAAPAAPKPAAPASEIRVAHGDAPQDHATPATERGAFNSAAIAAPAAGTTQQAADTVALSGPPTAWRQTLREALGERLQLQVGRNAEQAVIRLEPPMLGRVEIAIRHSAGSLEVHISATHGEVLRQLQTVSDSLRNDLAQRQFTDVSVNVAPAARSANGAPLFAGGDSRGRQQDERQQEQDPGNALAEANTGTSPFSLNGRGQGRS